MREKSKARRKVLALSIAGVISGIIFVVWLLAFIASSEQTSVQEGNNNNFSFGSFFESFQDEAENVKAQFNEFNISLESLKFEEDEENIAKEEKTPSSDENTEEVFDAEVF